LQIRDGVFAGISEIFLVLALGILMIVFGYITLATSLRYVATLELQTVNLVRTDIENAMIVARSEVMQLTTGYANLLAVEASRALSPGVISLEYDPEPPLSGFNHFVFVKNKGLIFQRNRVPDEVRESFYRILDNDRPYDVAVAQDRIMVVGLKPVKGTDWLAGIYMEIHPASRADAFTVTLRTVAKGEKLPISSVAPVLGQDIHEYVVPIRDAHDTPVAIVTISTRGFLASLRTKLWWTFSFLLVIVAYGVFFVTRNAIIYYGVFPVRYYVERLRESLEKGEVFRKMETTGEPGLDALSEQIDSLVNRMRDTQLREIAQLKELRFVHRLSESLLRVTSHHELAQLLVEEVQRAIGKGAVILRLLRDDQKSLECAAHIGIPEDLAEETAVLPIGRGLSGRVIVAGGPLFIQDYNHSEARVSSQPTPFYYGYCTPIRSGADIIGTLSVFTPEQVPIVQSIKRTLDIATQEFGVVFRGLRSVLKLRELKDFNDQILENMSEGLFVESANGSIEYANPFFLRLIGVRTRSAILGKRWDSLLSREDRHKLETAKDKPGDALMSYEARLRSNGGPLERTVRVTSTYLAAETGQAKRLNVVADISELKERETLIERHRQFLLTLTNALPAAVVVLTPAAEIVFCNSAFQQSFCLGEGEVLKNVVQGELALHLDEVLKTGKPVSGMEFEQSSVGPPRRKRYWRLSALNLPDRSEVLCVLVDVTDERDLARKIADTEKLIVLGEMLTRIGHQVNNPLTGVIGNAELLLGDAEPGTERYETISMILKSADRIRQTLRSLDIFARPERGGMSYFSLNTLLMDLIPLHEHSLRVKGITLETDPDPTLPDLLGDPFQIRQSLFNLIVNSEQAYDDTKRRGPIRIQTKWLPETKEALLTVQDQAGGMSEIVRQRALEPFFSTRSPDRASGMGLPIVYGVVRAHKGTLEIQTDKEAGTTVNLRFPVEPRPSPAEVIAEGPPPGVETLENLRILLVEDEPEVRVPLKRFLETEGASVDDAPDGRQALNLLATRDYEVVLLDLRLPDCDGSEIIHHLDRTRPGLLRAILVVTGLHITADEQDFFHSKRIPTLEKPFSMTDLRRKILHRLYGDLPV
jgi:PAS domain S-box-containing protein